MAKFGDVPTTELAAGVKFGDYLTTDEMPTGGIADSGADLVAVSRQTLPFNIPANSLTSPVAFPLTQVDWQNQPNRYSLTTNPERVYVPIVGVYVVAAAVMANSAAVHMRSIYIDWFDGTSVTSVIKKSFPQAGGNIWATFTMCRKTKTVNDYFAIRIGSSHSSPIQSYGQFSVERRS